MEKGGIPEVIKVSRRELELLADIQRVLRHSFGVTGGVSVLGLDSPDEDLHCGVVSLSEFQERAEDFSRNDGRNDQEGKGGPVQFAIENTDEDSEQSECEVVRKCRPHVGPHLSD